MKIRPTEEKPDIEVVVTKKPEIISSLNEENGDKKIPEKVVDITAGYKKPTEDKEDEKSVVSLEKVCYIFFKKNL